SARTFYNCQEWLDQAQATRLLRCNVKEAASVRTKSQSDVKTTMLAFHDSIDDVISVSY
ncbi:hypothetical protein V5799_006418, partial [Amblyomma americanum]